MYSARNHYFQAAGCPIESQPSTLDRRLSTSIDFQRYKKVSGDIMPASSNDQQLLGALYVRCASPLPDDAYYLDEQRLQVEKCAISDDVLIVKTYEDIGISGIINPSLRPGLSALLEDARKGVFNVLYIASQDRLSRRAEQVIDIARELHKTGVKIKISGYDETESTL
jgi:DNA invertase Pin-like site-specific DNA recombinase